MKTWTVKINEEELRALIQHHACKMTCGDTEHNTERSGRLHDLTKRLNKGDAEGEKQEAPIEGQTEKKADPWG